MIVVAGPLGLSRDALSGAGAVAARAAGSGDVVEAVGTVPDDAAGDAILLALRDAGVRHAAVLRTPAPALDGADLELALRYLPDIRAIVLVGATAELSRVAAAAAGWSDAALVLVAPPGADGSEIPADVAGDAVVLAAPSGDPDGAFAGLVAALAVRLAGGATAADAWAGATNALRVERLTPSGAAPSGVGPTGPAGPSREA